ncbi:unnamed protein product [Nesidiocoris tenuis]|uniref:Uncharacterized protein n=2 Tax=Nesidiocoris tenuis TaxID=355587 RepID=A0A6H5GD04_9HEMI|nr:unnamed protein product [Nesidiocoris tenuis]
MDDHYHLVIEKEQESRSCVLLEKDRKIEYLNKEIAVLQVALKEKDNEILEKQCSLLESQNNYIMLEKQCKLMQITTDDMNQWKMAVEKSEEELETMKESYLKEINNLKYKLQERDDQVNGLKSSLDRAFKRIDDVCLKKVLMENEFKQKVDELLREKSVEVEVEVNKRVEAEQKLVETYEGLVELRKRFEEEVTKNKNIEMAQKVLEHEYTIKIFCPSALCRTPYAVRCQSSERWWRRRMEEVESLCANREGELRRRLDNATIATSQAVLERTRLANEKIRLQCELRRKENSTHTEIIGIFLKDMRAELEQRILELEEANQELTQNFKTLWSAQPTSDVESPLLFSRQRSHPTSDYTSDPDQLENKNLVVLHKSAKRKLEKVENLALVLGYG